MSRTTVLLVDSHADSRAISAAILEHHGFAVLSAAAADEGVRLAREGAADVVVLEIAATHPVGLDAARRLKDDPATAGIPLVGLGTGFAPADRERALEAGVAVYLLKPCPPLQLLATVREVLGGG